MTVTGLPPAGPPKPRPSTTLEQPRPPVPGLSPAIFYRSGL